MLKPRIQIMEKKMETTGNTGFRGLGFRVYYSPIMENEMEKKMENELETLSPFKGVI